MKATQKLAADLFFWFQLTFSFIFGASQFVHMFHSTQGVSTSMFAAALIVVTVNGSLAVMAHKAHPSKATGQTVAIFVLGVVVYLALTTMMLVKGINVWDGKDWLTTILIFLSLIPVAIIAFTNHWSITNPMVRGLGSLCLKAVPQIVLAWKVATVGGQGFSLIFIVTFNIITICRIIQVYLTVRENKKDKNRRALFISEVGNELTWLLVTIAWIFNH